MPAKKEVTLRYPEEFVKNALNHFSTNLHTELSSRGFSREEIDLATNNHNLDFSWLSNQEINSILDCSSEQSQFDLLVHRIRFSLLPRNRIPTVVAHILLEPTSICNLHCPMCFQTDKSFTTNGIWAPWI